MSSLNAQDFTFQQINYTVEDGLPSNECHRVLQDSLGYIWIATDRGLVKYDGYKFRTYGIKDGLIDLSCLNMMFDTKGRIWVLTLSGQFFIYDPVFDKISLYKHQKLLEHFLSQSIISEFYIDDNMTLTCSGLGFITITDVGEVTVESKLIEDGIGQYITKILGSKILVSWTGFGEFNLSNDTESTRQVVKQGQSFFTPYYLYHRDTKVEDYLDQLNGIRILKGFRF